MRGLRRALGILACAPRTRVGTDVVPVFRRIDTMPAAGICEASAPSAGREMRTCPFPMASGRRHGAPLWARGMHKGAVRRFHLSGVVHARARESTEGAGGARPGSHKLVKQCALGVVLREGYVFLLVPDAGLAAAPLAGPPASGD